MSSTYGWRPFWHLASLVILASFSTVYFILQLIIGLVGRGPTRLFTAKQRHSAPVTWFDSKYGVHNYAKLPVSVRYLQRDAQLNRSQSITLKVTFT